MLGSAWILLKSIWTACLATAMLYYWMIVRANCWLFYSIFFHTFDFLCQFRVQYFDLLILSNRGFGLFFCCFFDSLISWTFFFYLGLRFILLYFDQQFHMVVLFLFWKNLLLEHQFKVTCIVLTKNLLTYVKDLDTISAISSKWRFLFKNREVIGCLTRNR